MPATIDALLSSAVAAALAAELGPELADHDPLVRRSADDRFGDYQSSVALALAKPLRRPPLEIAEALANHLREASPTVDVSVSPPGFLNFGLSAQALTDLLRHMLAGERAGIPEATPPRKVIVDYSSPNVAKEMHVGHLRSTIIGDSLARLFEFLGHEVVRQNHLGDWGTPFGMLIEHMLDIGQDEAIRELSVGDFTGFYQAAREKFDGDPDFADRARARVVALQSGDDTTTHHWRQLLEASNRYFSQIYERLGVRLTEADLAPESMYNPMLPSVAEELEHKSLARWDAGALCAFPPGFSRPDGEPLPLIIQKADGGFGYATTDLAALRHRALTVQADDVYYVVDARQATHFAMIFAVAAQAGWLDDTTTPAHVAFGSVLGPDKRPLKTRSGDLPKLADLLDEAVERAAAAVAEKNPGLDSETAAAVAHAVGIGAVKYADLSTDRVKDYVFDLDRMLQFEGNTGPYLQYAHARIRSILRRSGWEGDPADLVPHLAVDGDSERALALELIDLPRAVEGTAEALEPHRLCTYLFSLAKAFSAFYESSPVIDRTTKEPHLPRLALCVLTAQVLRLGLDLLGIEAPEAI